MKPLNLDGVLVPICPHCNVRGVLEREPFRRWVCPVAGCDARVGVHKDSARAAPLGTMARAPLRLARMRAHEAFDPLWKVKPPEFRTRRAAYEWLAGVLGIQVNRCHIGEFDEATCATVVSAIAQLDEVPR